jgi:Ran GTPase-activating protein (RanGAP) involved in mRNA processing and transport
MKKKITLFCPVKEVAEQLPFEYAEIDPLLQYLAANNQTDKETTFTRGTITNSGKLDCCKQNLGAAGASLLTEVLKYNTNIRSILLGTGGIGNEGAKSVGDLLRKNKSIRTVYLGCNLIEAEGVIALAESLEENEAVRSLWLKRNPIGEKGAIAIANLLKKNRNIRTLDLVNTGIGYRGLKVIIDTLIEEKYPIERFYVGGNNLGAKEAVLLALLIQKRYCLEELLLSVNDLRDTGVSFLAKALEGKCGLKNLGLGSNGMDEKACVQLFESLEKNNSLKRLDLGVAPSSFVLKGKENKIEKTSGEAIAKYFKTNKSLQYLNLKGNKIPYWTLREIKEALTKNTNMKQLRLGKGHSRIIKREISEMLSKNKITELHKLHEDVKDIISVYR